MNPNSQLPEPEDWSDPGKKPQMTAWKPILWMVIPFLLAVLWGYLSGS